MKTSRWIYMICALVLFSAHQTHRKDADKPDYSRSPAMVHPVEFRTPSVVKSKASHSLRAKGTFRKPDSRDL